MGLTQAQIDQVKSLFYEPDHPHLFWSGPRHNEQRSRMRTRDDDNEVFNLVINALEKLTDEGQERSGK